LERLLSKCPERDRDLRCQTAIELRADLKRLKRDTSSGKSAVASSSSLSSAPSSMSDALSSEPAPTLTTPSVRTNTVIPSEAPEGSELVGRNLSSSSQTISKSNKRLAVAFSALLILGLATLGAHKWLRPSSAFDPRQIEIRRLTDHSRVVDSA